MIRYDNYKLVCAYLENLGQMRRLSELSIGRYRSHLHHLLTWADDTSFGLLMKKCPTFEQYLETARRDVKGGKLARETVERIVATSQRFLIWAKAQHPHELRGLELAWINTLRPPRIEEQEAVHEFVTLDEVKQLIAAPTTEDTWILKRNQAAAAMLFLSGARDGSFCSWSLQCVNLKECSIKQWPELGVHTKNGKSATTFLLEIPELLEVVSEWDSYARTKLPPTAAWFTPTKGSWGHRSLSAEPPGFNRNIGFAKQVRQLFGLAGLPYKRPHAFRHGHAVFGLNRAKTPADFKAVSQNLMHENMKVTEEIYAKLANDDIKRRIAGLTGRPITSLNPNDDLQRVIDLVPQEQWMHLMLSLATRMAA